MGKKRPLSEYERGFIARVRAARALRFETQQEFCTAQKIEQDAYKWFETERLLPHENVESYCLAWGVTIPWLLTGKGAGPAVMPLPEKRKRRREPPKRKLRA